MEVYGIIISVCPSPVTTFESGDEF